MSLDAVQSLARSNGKSLNSVFGLSGGDGTKTDVSVFSPLFALAIDWNTTMQLINKEYDKILPVLQEPDFGARKKKHDEYDSQVKEMAARSKSAVNLVATSLLGTSQSRGHNIGEVLIVLLMPAIRQVSVAETRAEARMTVTRAAFAAELYRLDNGQYPESLDQLVPKSLEAVPSDPFTGKPLVYRRDEAAGFVVYSLGPNETDDDGRSYQAGKTTDDVAATGLPRKEDGP